MLVTADLSRRDFLRTSALSIGGLTVLGLTGCGMTEQPDSGGGDAASLTAAFNRPIISLDPHGPTDVDEGTLLACRHIFDTLVRRDGERFAPNVARRWSQPDDSTWLFELRDDVVFHDGSPLTAKDVKASLERVAASDTPQAELWATLKDVTTDDTHSLRITTDQPLGTMLANLTLLFVAPAGKLKEKGFFDKPIGSGPFRVDSYTASDHLDLSAAEKYWGSGTKLQKLKLPFIPENSTRLTSLKSGEVDVTWTIPPDQMEGLQGSSDLEITSVPSYLYYFNWFNCGRKPFTDKRVRQAMWHAVDVRKIVDSLFKDTAEVMKAPIPSTVFGYAEQQPYAYDPGKARQLLADAGHEKGFSTSLMWPRNMSPEIRSLAESFNTYWKEIGVNVKLEELEQAAWLKRLLDLDWDMDLQTNGVTTGDADYTLGRLYTTNADRLGYSNKELDRILRSARSSTDQKVREGLYGRACALLWDDAPGIYPVQLNSTYGLRRSVRGFEPAPDNQPLFTRVTKG
ncbi:MAG: ABC transporter substrate-binding protein [Streptosporangiales bacterium]|nr:ABC transporter substrate-binding protein [Streptosporangiales bacterium]